MRIALALAFGVVPFVLAMGVFALGNRSQVFVGLAMVLIAMLPFALMFERRRPQARELVLISVVIALAVAGRIAFFMIPQFKPTAAIVIVAGIWLGAETGFLTGMMSAFISNFFFGQGPWTPWQMLGFGLVGLLAGLVFRRFGDRCRPLPPRWALCLYGFVSVMAVYGPLVDISSVLYATGSVTVERVLAVYLAGVPFNFVHAASTALVLHVIGLPMGRKLVRIKEKFGLGSDGA